MSWLRQRATDVRTESTRRALRPALARLRLVMATRSASDDALNDPLSQAKVCAGAANVKTEVRPNRSATARAIRLGWRAMEGMGTDMRSAYSERIRLGFRCCGHRRYAMARCPLCDGPGGRGSLVPAGPVGSRAAGRRAGRCGAVRSARRDGPGRWSRYTAVARADRRRSARTNEQRGGLSSMAEQRFVEPPVAGSSPAGHPNSPRSRAFPLCPGFDTGTMRSP